MYGSVEHEQATCIDPIVYKNNSNKNPPATTAPTTYVYAKTTAVSEIRGMVIALLQKTNDQDKFTSCLSHKYNLYRREQGK